jgi:hypothetical protein
VVLSDSITASDSIGKATSLNKIESLVLTDLTSRQISIHSYDVIVSTDTFQIQLPNAPTLIGTIALKGSSMLYVYLVGSRSIDVNLKGGL